MVLFAIIKSVLSGSGEWSMKDEKSPLGIIKKTLIAGILIQASRFLMAALVDVSTVATYAVGWLPLNVLKKTPIGEKRILMVNSTLDLDKFSVFSEEGEGFKVRYSVNYKKPGTGVVRIDMSPCKIKSGFIIGRELWDPQYKHANIFTGNDPYAGNEVCVAFHSQLAMWREDDFMKAIMDTWAMASWPATGKVYNDHQSYKKVMKNLTNISWWHTLDFVKTGAINLSSWNKSPGIVTGKAFYVNDTTSMTISDLINRSKGFVGPLVTMYSSLLNFAELTDTQATTLGETSGVFIIKSLVAIGLFFPLLALAVVLVARIALLRLYIAASPFLIIKNVFDKLIPKEALGKLDKHLDLWNVIKLIFAPVVTVAALSISLIFMTALIDGFQPWDNQRISENVTSNLQITPIESWPDSEKYQFADSVNVEFKGFDRWWSLDRFSWLVVNFFAIGILRTILFAAIKANALGEKIGGEIQKFWANVFQTLPILPFGKEGQRVGLGSAFEELRQVPTRRVEERESEQRTLVKEYIEGTGEAPLISGAQAKTIVSSPNLREGIEQANLKVPKDISEYGTTDNRTAIYKAVEELYSNDPAQKNAAITKFAPMFGDNANRFQEEELLQIDNNFTTKISEQITNTQNTTQASIQSLITANRSYVDAYFKKHSNAPYEKQLTDANKTKIMITPVTDPQGNITTYTVTATATPSTPTTS